MAKCHVCGQQTVQGRGITYVETSGRIINFCSGKCRKNFHMGRDLNKLKWVTKAKEQQ